MRKRILFFLLIFLSDVELFSQADISMATHWYNRANYNPASIARTDYLYLFSNIRKQWVGVEGAPTVFNVQASQYVHQYRSAFGISMVSDKIGLTTVINPMLTYAYRISNNYDNAFALGLSAGVFSRYINSSEYEAVIVNDPSIQYNNETITHPDANFGLEYQTEHFIFGLSSTHLFALTNPDSLYLATNHRYGYAIFKNTNPEYFNYSLGLQMVNYSNVMVMEANAILRFKRPTGLKSNSSQEIFDLGFTARTSKQITFLFGINLSPNLRVGYAYNQTLSSLYKQNSTHEIMLEYRLLKKSASAKNSCHNTGYWYH